jgi:hypothetical protein
VLCGIARPVVGPLSGLRYGVELPAGHAGPELADARTPPGRRSEVSAMSFALNETGEPGVADAQARDHTRSRWRSSVPLIPPGSAIGASESTEGCVWGGHQSGASTRLRRPEG